MAKNFRAKSKGNPSRQRSRAAQPQRGAISLRKIPDRDAWEFVHPPCAIERAEDLTEVQQMIDAGELEIALDELRWLIDGCGDFIAAHRLLGELALQTGDVPLARGHFGYAWQIGLRAWRQAGQPVPLPYGQPANAAFFEAGRGLIQSFTQLGQTGSNNEIVTILLRCDPADPFDLANFRNLSRREHD